MSNNDFLGIDNSKSLSLSYIIEQEIIDVVYEVSNKTSTDCNDDRTEFVKNCIDKIHKALAAICNRSILESFLMA